MLTILGAVFIITKEMDKIFSCATLQANIALYL